MLTMGRILKDFVLTDRPWLTGESLARLFRVDVTEYRGSLYELAALRANGDQLELELKALCDSAFAFENALGRVISGGALADLLKRAGSALTRTAGLLGFSMS